MNDQSKIAPAYSGLNIYQRLHQVMKRIDYIQREQKAGMRYKIVSHDKVTGAVRPVLVDWGIVYYPLPFAIEQHGNRTHVSMTVRFQNIDDPADYIDVGTAGYGIDDQDKGPGKAISYSVKYALLKALGLESGDDPDEDQTTEYEPQDLKQIKQMVNTATTEDQLRVQWDNLQKLADTISKAQFQSTSTLIKQRKASLKKPEPADA